jgi:hypothetical protein
MVDVSVATQKYCGLSCFLTLAACNLVLAFLAFGHFDFDGVIEIAD